MAIRRLKMNSGRNIVMQDTTRRIIRKALIGFSLIFRTIMRTSCIASTHRTVWSVEAPIRSDRIGRVFLAKAAPDYAKAKQLLKEGGYDGLAVVLLQATNGSIEERGGDSWRRDGWADIMSGWSPMDWAGLTACRHVKSSPDQCGWNVFTSASRFLLGNPLSLSHQANGEKGWYGWPSD